MFLHRIAKDSTKWHRLKISPLSIGEGYVPPPKPLRAVNPPKFASIALLRIADPICVYARGEYARMFKPSINDCVQANADAILDVSRVVLGAPVR